MLTSPIIITSDSIAVILRYLTIISEDIRRAGFALSPLPRIPALAVFTNSHKLIIGIALRAIRTKVSSAALAGEVRVASAFPAAFISSAVFNQRTAVLTVFSLRAPGAVRLRVQTVPAVAGHRDVSGAGSVATADFFTALFQSHVAVMAEAGAGLARCAGPVLNAIALWR